MHTELHKLRIDKSHKARRDERRLWPWALLLLILLAARPWQGRRPTPRLKCPHPRPNPPHQNPRRLGGRLSVGRVMGGQMAGISVALNATGYIIAAHKIELASKVIGRVAWIGVEMGDKIQKDQILVRLEDDDYKARFAQEQGQLDNAKARLAELQAGSRPEEIAQAKALLDRAKIEAANAVRTYQRVAVVKDTRSISIPELEDDEAQMHALQAQADSVEQQYELMKLGPRKEEIAAQAATVSQLEGSLALARVDLENTVIRAPLAATVLERNVEVGEFVTNGFVGDRTTPKGYVVSLADLNDLLVELDISQNDFAKVAADQPCWIVTDAYPDHKYEGSVERISPLANRQKATILVRVRVLHPDERLRPDMNATVSFLSKAATTQPSNTSATPQTPPPRSPPHPPHPRQRHPQQRRLRHRIRQSHPPPRHRRPLHRHRRNRNQKRPHRRRRPHPHPSRIPTRKRPRKTPAMNLQEKPPRHQEHQEEINKK